MSQKHATLKDLAARLGVSTTTIHRALTGKPGISDQLRTTIQNLAVEMNYQPNLAASALKRNELHIAVLLITHPFGREFTNSWKTPAISMRFWTNTIILSFPEHMGKL